MHLGEVLGGFFDDHVGEEDAVGSGFGGLLAEGGHAEADYGIQVGEEDEAGLRAGLSELGG